MNFIELLKKIGFSENKAKVYLACLELGKATASQIAKEAKVVRTTIYKILEELKSQGFVEADAKLHGKTFKAQNPQKLVESLEQQKNLAQEFLPDFMNIFSETKFKPKLKFYEGKEGVKKVFEDILNYQNITVLTFSPIKNVLQIFGKTYSRHFTEKRAKQKIWRQDLRQFTDEQFHSSEWEFYASDKSLLREVKILPKNLTFDALIQVYENKISVILSEKENFAFIVESKELSDFMKKVFNFFWQAAGR
jgi:HTH-type transcriptional regulator, sugar sensing transcriptional regulator